MRLKLLFLSVTLLFLPIIYKLLLLQLLNQNYEHNIVRKTFRRNTKRGDIYDRDSNLLVTSTEWDKLSINPKKINNKDLLINELSLLLGVNPTDIYKIWNEEETFVIFNGQIKNHILEILRKNKENKFSGVIHDRYFKRTYLYESLATNLIGFVNHKGEGVSGVELFYDSYLKDGGNVHLTIDKTIQSFVDIEAKEAFNRYSAVKVMIAVQDPNSGEILAMSVYPTFDPSKPIENISLLKNPLVEDMYELGSIFKIIPLFAAIEEKISDKEKVVFCENGEWEYYEKKIKDHNKYKNLTIEGIMAHSSNIGMAKIGLKLTYPKIYKYAKEVFGVGMQTGIDLPNEAKGTIQPPSSNLVSIYTPVMSSIGYEVCVSPIQILSFYSLIANGGYFWQPFVVRRIEKNGKILYNFERLLIRRIPFTQTLQKTKNILKKVVDYGTGIRAKVRNYIVAGKTGTAEKLINGEYSNKRHIVSFCGFLPFESPKFTILVIIDEPKPIFWASETAAVVFSNVAQKIINYYEVKNYADPKEFTSTN